MNILILGSGGRESALEWKLSQSKRVSKVFTCPGNGGSLNPIVGDLSNHQSIIDLAISYEIDLTVVGPEVPLCEGIVDAFTDAGLKIFGPNKRAAYLEASKDYSKEFMNKYHINTASSKTYTSYESACAELDLYQYPLVLKADGLCQGKGVVIVHNKEQALASLKAFFIEQVFAENGQKVIIEEYLDGDEISLICFVSNNEIYPLASARDYKKIGENDEGANTGGVGAYSPARSLSLKEKAQVDIILNNISLGMKKEALYFSGVLFIGLMICDEEVYVLEFNTRFGDPETQVIMPRLESDLVDLMFALIDNNLSQKMIKLKDKKALCTILVSDGYPDQFTTGHLIDIKDDGLLFHNGTKRVGDKVYTNGGRVLSLVELGDDYENMNKVIQKRLSKIDFVNKYYRKDIGILK